MKVDEKGWKQIKGDKIDENVWKWMEMDERGWKLMNMDKSGWKYLRWWYINLWSHFIKVLQKNPNNKQIRSLTFAIGLSSFSVAEQPNGSKWGYQPSVEIKTYIHKKPHWLHDKVHQPDNRLKCRSLKVQWVQSYS